MRLLPSSFIIVTPVCFLWQVPSYIYDRSTFIFVTALSLDLLNILFERHTTKVDFVMYPAFIKGMASTTNLVTRFGTPIVAFSTTGRL